jgi:hypothetical protein
MEVEKIVNIIAGIFGTVVSLHYIYEKFFKEGGMKPSSKSISSAKTQPDVAFSRKWSPLLITACVVVFTLSGFVWLLKSDKQVTALQAQISTFQTNTYQDLAPTKLIQGRTFRNEKVFLDGYHYSYCKFTFVTFVYEGKRPFAIDNCEINPPVGFNLNPSSQVIMVLLDSLGFLNTNKFDMGDLKKHEKPPNFEP